MIFCGKWICVPLLLLFSNGLFAIIILEMPLSAIYTTAPNFVDVNPSDVGFSHVGQVNGSTGVYIGNGWVLTANHVGAADFTLGGVTYDYNGVDSHQIGGVDLRLFRLASAPALNSLTLASSSPTVDELVVMIGAGRSAQSNTPTLWYVDTDPADWVWNTSSFTEADAGFSGFTTSATRAVRWGTNLIDSVQYNANYQGYSPTNLLVTDFDSSGATSYEAQAVTNDSGGGLFTVNNGNLELSGTIVRVGTFDSQPGGASTAIFNNITQSIDLAQYVPEINSYLLMPVPEPAAYGLCLALVSLCFICRRRA